MSIYISKLNGIGGTVLLSQENVVSIATGLGMQTLDIPRYNAVDGAEIASRIDGIIANIKCDDTVVIQSPSWNNTIFDEMLIDKLQSVSKAKIVLFVNDVIPIMFNQGEQSIKRSIDMFNKADVLIMPSKNMHDYLIQRGLSVEKVVYQTLWDFVNVKGCKAKGLIRRMCHPGNPDRSPFLLEWKGATTIEAYGGQQYSVAEDVNTVRRGYMENDVLIEDMSRGGFGLLWSEGSHYEYYKMNQAYKAPTYIAAGLPIIVRDGFNVAQYVKENSIGFVVSSLKEADDIVQNISEEEYNELLKNVEKVKEKVLTGAYTREVLATAVAECQKDSRIVPDDWFCAFTCFETWTRHYRLNADKTVYDIEGTGNKDEQFWDYTDNELRFFDGNHRQTASMMLDTVQDSIPQIKYCSYKGKSIFGPDVKAVCSPVRAGFIKNSLVLNNNIRGDIMNNCIVAGIHTVGTADIRMPGPESKLIIGDYCSVGNITIVTDINDARVGQYPFEDSFWISKDIKHEIKQADPVTRIGNDVQLGDCTIREGVTIGDGAVVYDGSVIGENVPAYAIVMGNPAVISGYRYNERIISDLEKIAWWEWDEDTVADRIEEIKGADAEGFCKKYLS